jgi:uncharacterized membrane protein
MKIIFTTKQIALMSVFAALIAILTRFPGIPLIGSPDAKLQLSVVLYPLIGVLLGGRVGAITVLAGNFVSWLIPPSTLLGLLMIPPGAFAALVAGSLRSEKGSYNWKLASAVLAVLNVCWYLTSVGREAPFYPVLHWSAFLLVILFRGRVHSFLEDGSRLHTFVGMGICSFAGLMADSMAGNLIFIYAVGLVVPLRNVLNAVANLGMLWVKFGIPPMPVTGLAALFMTVILITVIERTAMTIASTLIGSAVLRLLGNEKALISD